MKLNNSQVKLLQSMKEEIFDQLGIRVGYAGPCVQIIHPQDNFIIFQEGVVIFDDDGVPKVESGDTHLITQEDFINLFNNSLNNENDCEGDTCIPELDTSESAKLFMDKFLSCMENGMLNTYPIVSRTFNDVKVKVKKLPVGYIAYILDKNHQSILEFSNLEWLNRDINRSELQKSNLNGKLGGNEEPEFVEQFTNKIQQEIDYLKYVIKVVEEFEE